VTARPKGVIKKGSKDLSDGATALSWKLLKPFGGKLELCSLMSSERGYSLRSRIHRW